AGLKTSSYQKFLMDLREKLPVINAMGAIDSEGNYYEDALDSPYKDLVKQYQILQYNNLIDTSHTIDSFFYLTK
ncbi:MAG: LTA synthase family protein, partial [Eubacterium sp.]|nr:LTA synthase family protein [Eubacterium sp.]